MKASTVLWFVTAGGLGAIVACLDVRHPAALTFLLIVVAYAAMNFITETIEESK